MTINEKNLKNLGRLGLVLASFLWGVSFVLMKNVLSSIPPLYILAIRFCGATLILLPACAGKIKKFDKAYLRGGITMGVALLLSYLFQTYGLNLTTPGKNAFLTSTYCVIVPFLFWVYIHLTIRKKSSAKISLSGTESWVNKRPDRYNAAAAIICLAGMGLISLDGDLRIGTGDALTIICGFFFALHIVVTAKFIDGRDPVMLAMLQFASAGVLSMIAAIILEPFPSGLAAADVWSIVFLTVVSTAGCLLMQIFGQKYTPPAQAAVIMTLESVFGALSSVIVFREVLTFRLIAGFALTFAAVIISETKLEFFRNKRIR